MLVKSHRVNERCTSGERAVGKIKVKWWEMSVFIFWHCFIGCHSIPQLEKLDSEKEDLSFSDSGVKQLRVFMG